MLTMALIAMDNPFAIGDLVHLPQGTILYRILDTNKKMLHDIPMPIKMTDKPTVGLIINKSIYDFYKVSVGNKEYLIKAEQMNYQNENNKYAY